MTCRVIAELSCNHLGSLERALELISACARAGAHAVKIQCWQPGTMVLDRSLVLRKGPWVGENLFNLYEKAQTPPHWIGPIFERAKDEKIEAFASVFDRESLETLKLMRCQRYKVASFELVDLPLIRALAQTSKPLILSTGMATAEEISNAVETAEDAGCRDITLLKCTSAYPADGAAANLATMRAMSLRWDVPTGLSDHTAGIGVAIAAAAMGAVMIEKHVTLKRSDGGYDAAFSLEPAELAQLVLEVARVEKALGSATAYGPSLHEEPQLELRRSLYFSQDVSAGTYLGEHHICTARPALGLAPRLYWRCLGAKLLVDVRRGQPVSWEVMALRQPAGIK